MSDEPTTVDQILAEVEGLSTLQMTQHVQRVVDAALVAEDGPQRVVQWWLAGAASRQTNYPRAIVASHVQHELAAQHARRYAELEFDAMKTRDPATVTDGFCSCDECRRTLRDERARVAAQRLTELPAAAREHAIRVLHQARVPPDIEALKTCLADGPSTAATVWLKNDASAARELVIHLLRTRIGIEAAIDILTRLNLQLDPDIRAAAAEVFADPGQDALLRELALTIRPHTPWDVAGFDTLEYPILASEIERHTHVAPWPDWASGDDLPPVASDVPNFRARLCDLARRQNPRDVALLHALAAFHDASELAAVSEVLHERWIRAGRPQDRCPLALVVLFATPTYFRQAMLDVADLTPNELSPMLKALSLDQRGHDWIAHWSRQHDDEDLRRTARQLLEDEAKVRARTPRTFREALDPHVADAALERDGTTPELYAEVFQRAWDSDRRWDIADFAANYLAKPSRMEHATGLVFLIDGTACTLIDGELIDVDGGTVSLPKAGKVALAHPAELGSTLARWRAPFVDHEIVQPIVQLEADVFDEAAIAAMLEAAQTGPFTQRLYELGWYWDDASEAIERRGPRGDLFYLELASEDADRMSWGFRRPSPPRPRFVSRIGAELSRAIKAVE